MTAFATETQSQVGPGSLPAAARRVLLVGNPNVGKSALFFALTGRYVTVSNYPGTTIEVTRGPCALEEGAPVELVDTPGTTSLSPLSEDERVTCDIVAAQDAADATLVAVADARNLRRGLSLALDLAATGLPMVLVVNMVDEARARGLAIDVERLGRILGVPAVATAATFGEGILALRRAIPRARPALPADEIARFAPHAPADEGEERRLAIADAIRAEVLRANPDAVMGGLRYRLAVGFGRAAVHPLWGWPILAAVLYASYLVVGKLGAGWAVDFLQNTVFGGPDGGGLNGILAGALASVGARLSAAGAPGFVLAAHGFLQDLLFGPYGAMTMAVTYALALVLPIVAFFFAVFGLLEDTGYLPRLAVVSNRAFATMGLNGKAVLPMVLGLGCDTMATMATRILATRRERLIVSLLLALAVPCSAQLAVVLGLFSVAGGPRYLAVWAGIVVAVMLATGWLAGRLLPGATSDFIIELPPIRRPSVANILRKTLARIEWYLREAVPLFVLGTLLLFTLDRLALLGVLTSAAEPLVTGVLGLPKECAAAFVVGFLRRDYGAVYLFDAARQGLLSPEQVLVATVTITLFLPCVASYFMLVREFGKKTALGVAAIVLVIAFGVGGVMNLALSL